MFVQNRPGICQREPGFAGDHAVARGHDIRYFGGWGMIGVADIAAGDDAQQMILCVHHGETADPFGLHDVDQIGEFDIRTDGLGVVDDDIFTAFDFTDHIRLFLNGTVAVNDANAAFPGQGNGKFVFGDGIHGGGDQGNIQGNTLGEAGADIGFSGNDFAELWHHQHIVISESFRNFSMHIGSFHLNSFGARAINRNFCQFRRQGVRGVGGKS